MEKRLVELEEELEEANGVNQELRAVIEKLRAVIEKLRAPYEAAMGRPELAQHNTQRYNPEGDEALATWGISKHTLSSSFEQSFFSGEQDPAIVAHWMDPNLPDNQFAELFPSLEEGYGLNVQLNTDTF